jgi:hypothetical protein
MNVEIGAEAALFPKKEYINGIAIAVQTCMEVLVQDEWIRLDKAKEGGQVTTHDGLHMWRELSEAGGEESSTAEEGSGLPSRLLSGRQKNSALVRLLHLRSGGMCRGCCTLG